MSHYSGGKPLHTGPAAGITAAAAYALAAAVEIGNLIYTKIVVDLTGLRSTGADDVIGDDGTSSACYLARIRAAESGTIIGGSVKCLEVPAGGDPDINVYASTNAAAAESADVATLTGTGILINAGDHTNGRVLGFTALPADGEYIYLAAGAATDADYTAGILEIELIGVKS